MASKNTKVLKIWAPFEKKIMTNLCDRVPEATKATEFWCWMPEWKGANRSGERNEYIQSAFFMCQEFYLFVLFIWTKGPFELVSLFSGYRCKETGFRECSKKNPEPVKGRVRIQTVWPATGLRRKAGVSLTSGRSTYSVLLWAVYAHWSLIAALLAMPEQKRHLERKKSL